MKELLTGLGILLAFILIIMYMLKDSRTVETYEMSRPSNCADVAVSLDTTCATANPSFPKNGPYADANHKYCCK